MLNIDKSFFLSMKTLVTRETLPLFRQSIDIENKDDRGFDPVTEADKKTELAIRNAIKAQFPDHGILGEEFESENLDSDFVWVIDPIDGTRSFITGMPLWGVLIGLMHKGKSVMGAMIQPYIGEMFYTLGQGSYFHHQDFGREDKKISASQCQSLAEARLFTTDPDLFKKEDQAKFQQIHSKAKLVRYSADCYAFALLASGTVDVVIETGLKPYDIAALIPIIEQAGGVITQWDGGRAELAGNIIAAATPRLHKEMCDLLI